MSQSLTCEPTPRPWHSFQTEVNLGEAKLRSNTIAVVSLVPRPHPKIGKGAWCYLQRFPYVLCQQSSFGVEESRSSIANYNIPSSII